MTKEQQKAVKAFERELETRRSKIEQRREAVRAESGRSISDNRARWLRTSSSSTPPRRATA